MGEFSRTTKEVWSRPPSDEVVIEIKGHGDQHDGVLRNFSDAILDDTPLIAPATDGIRSVELANAMILSGWTDQTVPIPLDGAAYERHLQQVVAASRFEKRTVDARAGDFSRSFGGTP